MAFATLEKTPDGEKERSRETPVLYSFQKSITADYAAKTASLGLFTETAILFSGKEENPLNEGSVLLWYLTGIKSLSDAAQGQKGLCVNKP